MKIGFIGLGNVGGKLAGSLFRNKFDLTVYDLDKSVADEFKSKGVKVANSVGDLVKNVDVIITCLPSPKICLLYTSPSPRDRSLSRMPSSA